jgi:hypothetical protein
MSLLAMLEVKTTALRVLMRGTLAMIIMPSRIMLSLDEPLLGS